MKYISSIVICFFCFNSLTQVEIKLWDQMNQNTIGSSINGTEYLINPPLDSDHAVTFNFKNKSGNSKSWKIERFRIIDTPTWEDRLNWGVANDPLQEQGYTPGQMASNPWTVAYSYTVDSENSLNLTAITNVQGSGTELYRYYLIENNGVRIDSVDLRVTTTLGVLDKKKEFISIFPNPVSEILTIQQESDNPQAAYEFKITDSQGKVIFTEFIHKLDHVDVGNFKNGVYSVLIFKDKEQMQTIPIVILHD
nr:T9SS type A sorting domain-containing protein [uncultured Fluviicola sp.]